MRIVRTGSNQVLAMDFVKNYLKIDPDIEIEDDVIELAIEAAADETDQLMMFTVLMDTFDVVVPYVDSDCITVETFGPVQRLIDVTVKKWDNTNQLIVDSTLVDFTDYDHEIDGNGRLTIELTESGKGKIDKGKYLVANVYAGAYESESEIPAATKKAMLKMIADMVETRVDVNNVKGGDWRASDRQIYLRRQWRF